MLSKSAKSPSAGESDTYKVRFSHLTGRITATSGAFFLAALALGGCSADAADEGDLSGELSASTSQAIYAGTTDNDAKANGSVVSLKIGGGSQFELCSASLVAPNLLLTARHCVSRNLKPTVSCDATGGSGNGDQLGEDVPLHSIHVFTGDRPTFSGKPSAAATALLHPGGAVLCNADVAMIVLDRPLEGVKPLKLRLKGSVKPGETIRTVGYGQNDQRIPIGTRLRKDGLKVLAVGQGLSASETPLGSNEFEVGLSICQGDSGGPAISEATGAVIGVVSRGGSCTDDFGHIYTATSGFVPLLMRGFEIAGADLRAASESPDFDPATDVVTGQTGAGSVRRGATTPEEPKAGTRAQGCSASAQDRHDNPGWLSAGFALLALASLRRRRT